MNDSLLLLLLVYGLISNKETLSAGDGNAYVLSLCRHESVSRENNLTVLSVNPTTRNLDLCLPSGMFPISIHIISLSNVNFSISVKLLIESNSKYIISPPINPITTYFGLDVALIILPSVIH